MTGGLAGASPPAPGLLSLLARGIACESLTEDLHDALAPQLHPPMSRRSLLAAVRDRMHKRAAEPKTPPSPPVETVAPVGERSPRAELEAENEVARLGGEARYHRERHALYRARLTSGSGATSPGRLRELEQVAAAAQDRLAHAKRLLRAPGGGRT